MDGAIQELHELGDLLVLHNPVPEGHTGILRLVLLIPVLDLSGGFMHEGGSFAYCSLNFVKRRLHYILTIHSDLEGGLLHLLDQLGKAVFCYVEQALVHGPVEVRCEFLDLIGSPGSLRRLLADDLDSITDSIFGLDVGNLYLFDFSGIPLLLLLSEFVDSLGTLGQTDSDGLAEVLNFVRDLVGHLRHVRCVRNPTM